MDIVIYDIETFREMFLLGVYVPENDTYIELSIDRSGNQLYEMVKLFEKYSSYYFVGFNNIAFDGQIIEWIIRKYQTWTDLSYLELSNMISVKADNIIENSNNNIPGPYVEAWMHLKQIDLFKIHHFDNKNKRTSLKWCEFSMDFDNVEDMPIPHTKEHLSLEEIALVKAYCKNDVMATYELYKWTIGECSNPEYKGKNKIQDRLNLMEEIGLPCLNWSDVTIGEEWNRKDYTELTGRRGRDLYPKKVRQVFGMKYRDFFPSTVKFCTDAVKSFIRDVGEIFVLNEKQIHKISLGGNTIALGKGGIHSSEGPRYIYSDEKHQYIQVDIGSQYPNAYRKYNLFPAHLGKPANEIIIRKIQRRLSDKALFKKTKELKYKSLEEMGKLALNGGLYGKLKQKGSFLEDHVCQLKITMGCQLEILMIVEMLVMEKFHVVSLNTDGFDVIVEKRRLDEFYAICQALEERIGNSGEGNGNLEFTLFDWIAQLSVSAYLARKADGELKKKGKEFSTDVLLNENKSRRIIPLALEAYFDRGIEPEEFIPSHKNIFDFCIGVKSGKDYHYKTVDSDNIEEMVDKRVVRYYVSKNGKKLLKVKRAGSEAKGNAVQECEAPKGGHVWLCTIANNINRSLPIETYNIDYEYYINKTNNIIAQIKAEKKNVKKENPNQLTLF